MGLSLSFQFSFPEKPAYDTVELLWLTLAIQGEFTEKSTEGQAIAGGEADVQPDTVWIIVVLACIVFVVLLLTLQGILRIYRRLTKKLLRRKQSEK